MNIPSEPVITIAPRGSAVGFQLEGRGERRSCYWRGVLVHAPEKGVQRFSKVEFRELD